MENRIFDKKHVIISRIQEEDLNSFLLDLDIGEDGQPYYPLNEFANSIMNAIPEYVFAQYENPDIPQNDAVEKIRQAAKSIYRINDFEIMRKWYLANDETAQKDIEKMSAYSRGEFGEILLHLLLREFKGTIPLVSKVYFKDSAGVPAHGFDAVHISPNEKILWLGESKLYTAATDGLGALVKDLSEHFTRDFLDEQFIIIKKNLENNSIPQRNEWIKNLSECSKLRDKIKMINIPMLCTYSDDIYRQFSNLENQEAITYHETHVRNLKKYFDDHNNNPLKDNLNIILFLFPVRDKIELVKLLHERLWHMQSL